MNDKLIEAMGKLAAELASYSDQGNHRRIPGPSAGRAWEMAQEIRAALAVMQRDSGWVSVEDRLPDDSRVVLATYRSRITGNGLRSIAYHDPEHGWATTHGSAISPTHWMPLPLAPDDAAAPQPEPTP